MCLAKESMQKMESLFKTLPNLLGATVDKLSSNKVKNTQTFSLKAVNEKKIKLHQIGQYSSSY
jgi:hypothetical protein